MFRAMRPLEIEFGLAEWSWPVWKSKVYGAFVLNHRVVLHAIDARPARWRDDADSSPLDEARTAASSPRNDLVKNYRVHPTHCLISTQARSPWTTWTTSGTTRTASTTPSRRAASAPRTGRIARAGTRTRRSRPRPPTQPSNSPRARAPHDQFLSSVGGPRPPSHRSEAPRPPVATKYLFPRRTSRRRRRDDITFPRRRRRCGEAPESHRRTRSSRSR